MKFEMHLLKNWTTTDFIDKLTRKYIIKTNLLTNFHTCVAVLQEV